MLSSSLPSSSRALNLYPKAAGIGVLIFLEFGRSHARLLTFADDIERRLSQPQMHIDNVALRPNDIFDACRKLLYVQN